MSYEYADNIIYEAKGKGNPTQAWTKPEDSTRLRFPGF